ncbi:hypothetical protein [Tenacibaculum sp.]|jgi:hypothetical protein|uniref:hypothetical protein n=1 Tax=Tenacibaculum sp. TaxID=1906242 RepID=UPI003AA8332A
MSTLTALKPYSLVSSGLFHVENIKVGKYSTGNLEAKSSGSIHLINDGLSFEETLKMTSHASGTIALGRSLRAKSLDVNCNDASNVQAMSITLEDGSCNINVKNSATVVMYVDFGKIKTITGSVEKASTLIIYAKNPPINNQIKVDASSTMNISGWS